VRHLYALLQATQFALCIGIYGGEYYPSAIIYPARRYLAGSGANLRIYGKHIADIIALRQAALYGRLTLQKAQKLCIALTVYYWFYHIMLLKRGITAAVIYTI
jgi:hypothetical protein